MKPKVWLHFSKDSCPPRRIEIPNLWYTDGNDEQHNQDAILVQANDCAHATNLTLYKKRIILSRNIRAKVHYKNRNSVQSEELTENKNEWKSLTQSFLPRKNNYILCRLMTPPRYENFVLWTQKYSDKNWHHQMVTKWVVCIHTTPSGATCLCVCQYHTTLHTMPIFADYFLTAKVWLANGQ